MNSTSLRSDRSQQLLRIASARAALQAATTFQEIKCVREDAEEIRAYAKRTAMGLDLQNFAAELKLQAERRGGKLLSQLKLRGGDRLQKRGHRKHLRLRDLGIDKNLSARWQLEASVPESAFRDFVRTHFQDRREISSSALIAVGRRLREEPIDNFLVEANARTEVSSTSHLVDLNVDSLTHNGPKLDELNALVTETRNHYEVLVGLIVELLNQLAVTSTATEHRVVTRYINEVNDHLKELSLVIANIEHSANYVSL